jgi:hypothetical protein
MCPRTSLQAAVRVAYELEELDVEGFGNRKDGGKALRILNLATFRAYLFSKKSNLYRGLTSVIVLVRRVCLRSSS